MRLLDIEGVADKLGVSVRTVERLKARGELPPHRLVLGCHRWLEDEIEAFIRALPRFDRAELAARAPATAEEVRPWAT